jgi:hypothetical protein
MLDLLVDWYSNTKSTWIKNSQNYFGFSPILTGSIFHHNIWVVKNTFIFQDKWILSGHLQGFFL